MDGYPKGLLLSFIWIALLTWFSSAQAQNFLQTVAPEAHIALAINDVATGTVLADYNSEKLFVPASLTKIVTTISALNILGEDFRFSTRIYIHGTVSDSTLTGDLIVVGGGDPAFGSRYFAQKQPTMVIQTIFAQLRNQGITQLNGRLIIDTSIIPEPRYPAHRLWEDMGNYYGAPPSGLSWRDNTFELDLSSPPLPGKLCEIVAIRPPQKELEFKSRVFSASNNKDSAYIFGYPGLSKWEVRGSIPTHQNVFTIKGALPDPAYQFALELASELGAGNNIVVQIVNNHPVDISDAVLVTTVYSPSLSEIIKVVNQKSLNLMADHLFLALTRSENITGDNWLQSAKTMVDFWNEKFEAGTVRLFDGSGLSPRNLLSAKFLVELLIQNEKSRFGQTFESSLAVGGQTGTLTTMWKQKQWTGRIKAKSGSMEGVLGYAGYIYTQDNRKLAFCVLVNNYIQSTVSIKRAIEKEIGYYINLK